MDNSENLINQIKLEMAHLLAAMPGSDFLDTMHFFAHHYGYCFEHPDGIGEFCGWLQGHLEELDSRPREDMSKLPKVLVHASDDTLAVFGAEQAAAANGISVDEMMNRLVGIFKNMHDMEGQKVSENSEARKEGHVKRDERLCADKDSFEVQAYLSVVARLDREQYTKLMNDTRSALVEQLQQGVFTLSGESVLPEQEKDNPANELYVDIDPPIPFTMQVEAERPAGR